MKLSRLMLPVFVTLCSPLAVIAAQVEPDAAPASGQAVFEQWCATCHADRPRMPGTMALAIKYNGARPAAIEEWTNLSPQATAYFVRRGIGAMPRFRKTEISDAELEQLAAYLAGGSRR